MNQHLNLRSFALVGLFLALAGVIMAERTSSRVLVVSGQTASAPILQIRGRSYVDVEILAQVTNGSLSFESNRIILTIPAPTPAAGDSESPQKLSKGFTNAALGALAQMREWKGAIETMIQFQVPVGGSWLQGYADQAETGLRLAKVAASNAADQSAMRLLENEYANLSQWAGNAVDQRRALNATRTMSPDVLRNDQELQNIWNCAQFLGSMLSSGMFSESPACY